jgi:uncharacterized FlaG/YvyC family protein
MTRLQTSRRLDRYNYSGDSKLAKDLDSIRKELETIPVSNIEFKYDNQLGTIVATVTLGNKILKFKLTTEAI